MTEERIWDKVIKMIVEDYNRTGVRINFCGCDIIKEIEKKLNKK